MSSAVGHPILYRRGTAAAIARGPVLLTGDAAGLADEFTAEGIAYAVHSGTLVDRSIQAELDAARAISRMYYRCVTLSPRLALWASRQVDYFWRAFFRVMRGEARYDSEVKMFRFHERLIRELEAIPGGEMKVQEYSQPSAGSLLMSQ